MQSESPYSALLSIRQPFCSIETRANQFPVGPIGSHYCVSAAFIINSLDADDSGWLFSE